MQPLAGMQQGRVVQWQQQPPAVHHHQQQQQQQQQQERQQGQLGILAALDLQDEAGARVWALQPRVARKVHNVRSAAALQRLTGQLDTLRQQPQGKL